MKKYFMSIVILLLLGNTTNLAASQTAVLREPPENYALSLDAVVYVENDGRCEYEQVIKVTGGKKREGIPRKYECVKRPN